MFSVAEGEKGRKLRRMSETIRVRLVGAEPFEHIDVPVLPGETPVDVAARVERELQTVSHQFGQPDPLGEFPPIAANVCNCCHRRPKEVGSLLCADCGRSAGEEGLRRDVAELQSAAGLSVATFEDDRGNLRPIASLPYSEGGLAIGRPPPTSFRFVDENGTRDVLVLHRDGRVEIGAHLTPDEAGQRVFEILRDLWARHMGAPEPSEDDDKVDTRALPPAQWKALRDAAEAVFAALPKEPSR